MFRLDADEGLGKFIGRLLETIAEAVPDVAAEPTYILTLTLPDCYGLFVPGMDAIFKEELLAGGKWGGPGLAVAVDRDRAFADAYTQARAAGLSEPQADRLAREHLATVTIHELAHAVARKGEDAGIMAFGPVVARKSLDHFLDGTPLPEKFTVKPRLLPWQGHDLPFIRAAGIMRHRLLDSLPLPFGQIAPTTRYGLAEPEFYYRSMAHDGDFDRGGSVRRILDQGTGEMLRARFRSDVFSWFQRTPMGEAETKAAEKALALASC